MPEVCDFGTMFSDANLRREKNGPLRITNNNDSSEIFHFQAGGRERNQAVLTLNIRDNTELISVLINNSFIGRIERAFGLNEGVWQSQTIIFPARLLNRRNQLRFELATPNGDFWVKDIVCWFHQDA